MAVTIAEFLASVGFKADEGSLKSALAKVAGFGAAAPWPPARLLPASCASPKAK